MQMAWSSAQCDTCNRRQWPITQPWYFSDDETLMAACLSTTTMHGQKAGLEAIAALSEKAQVIFLSHYVHLVQTVQDIVGKQVNVVVL
jgi:hypothetical protein